jgi:RNA polymerase-binding transcription factor DksA
MPIKAARHRRITTLRKVPQEMNEISPCRGIRDALIHRARNSIPDGYSGFANDFPTPDPIMADKKKPAKTAETVKPATKPAAKPAAKAAVAKPADSKAKPAPKAAAPAAKPPEKPKKGVETALEEEVKAPAAKANGTAPVKVSGFALKQRQRLLDLRDELVDAMSGMTGEIRNAPEGSEASGSGMHQGDAGSDAYDRDFALSVLAKEQDALYEIEQALRRIDRGAYGICEMSGKTIPQARLEAIPFARLTVECQAQWEKEYGNRRFRPSNEVGFSGGHYQDDEDSETVSLDEDDD